MDCPKCGFALTALETDCLRCRRIAAEEFAKSPAAVWPPAIVGPPPPPAVTFVAPPVQEVDDSRENTSGSEFGVPLDVADRQWNWGAFFFGWLWCLCHGLIGAALGIVGLHIALVYFSIVILPSGWYLPSALMALVIFGANCYLGLHGYRLAWENRHFAGGMSQFFRVQRAWAISGFVTAGVSTLFFGVSTFLFLSAFQAYEARRQQAVPVAAAPAVPTGPAPIILRSSPPDQAPRPPILGGQGFRHPWDNPGPDPPQYRPGFGPGDVRNDPPPQAAPAPIAPVPTAPTAPASPVTSSPDTSAPPPDAPPTQTNPAPTPADSTPPTPTAPTAAPATP